jgi:hypothetical protein
MREIEFIFRLGSHSIIQSTLINWIPAFAGMAKLGQKIF